MKVTPSGAGSVNEGAQVPEKLEAGGDPCEDWRKINELIDYLKTVQANGVINLSGFLTTDAARQAGLNV